MNEPTHTSPLQPGNTATVRTVLGDVPADALGVTLVHEHLYCDITGLMPEHEMAGRPPLRDLLVAETPKSVLDRDPLASRDNCILDDEADALAELALFGAAGGGTVVDCTSIGLGRDVAALARIAAASNVHVVAPTGLYLWHTTADFIGERDAAALAEWMIKEIEQGIDGTDVRAGVIGEIGTSTELHDLEIRALTAAGIAHAQTGVAVSVHLDQEGRQGHRVIDLLTSLGVDPRRIVIGHLDQRHDRAVDYVLELAREGVRLGFDTWGTTFAYDSWGSDDPTDSERIRLLAEVVDAGYGSQVVMSHDMGLKSMMRKYGGGGLAHLPGTLWPTMVDRGISADLFGTFFVDNPRRWLSGSDT
ncbi:phosphotriesterase [Streptomyces luteogriseus]|uniref:phosphotriesterase n=1 Tax=Streptomyces luteogriseus TaxID=68233 RepID=UPI0037B01931